MIGLSILVALTGCTNSSKVLTGFSGSWAGTVTAEAIPSTTSATFSFVNDEYLDGTMTIQEPRGEQTYSIRRAEVFGKSVVIDLQTIDLVYNLHLDGDSGEGSYSGQATMTTECGMPAPCGWQGDFTLTLAAPAPTPPLTTAPTQPTSPTGTPPTKPTDTGGKTTKPNDTAPPDDTAAP